MCLSFLNCTQGENTWPDGISSDLRAIHTSKIVCVLDAECAFLIPSSEKDSYLLLLFSKCWPIQHIDILFDQLPICSKTFVPESTVELLENVIITPSLHENHSRIKMQSHMKVPVGSLMGNVHSS